MSQVNNKKKYLETSFPLHSVQYSKIQSNGTPV